MALLATKFWHRCLHWERLTLWNYFTWMLLFVLSVLLELRNAKYRLHVYEQTSNESLNRERTTVAWQVPFIALPQPGTNNVQNSTHCCSKPYGENRQNISYSFKPFNCNFKCQERICFKRYKTLQLPCWVGSNTLYAGGFRFKYIPETDGSYWDFSCNRWN